MPNNRYLVVDIPTLGPNKGRITKVWDYDLHFTDAHLLRKKIANRRMSKWPVVIDPELEEHQKVGYADPLAFPTLDECAALMINAVKLSEMDELWKIRHAVIAAGVAAIEAAAPVGIDDSDLAAMRKTALEVARQAADEANARAQKVAEEIAAQSELERAHGVMSEPVPVTISHGYMGDPTKWCFWESEYPEEGVFGPYDNELAVRAVIADLAPSAHYVVETVRETPPAWLTPAELAPEQGQPVDGPCVVLPRVTKREDGAYVAGPPPDGRSIEAHLDELIDAPTANPE